ncbi:MAG: hypothetical protein LBS90_04245 [Oscillospiraceae bacterium]|jgi:hypothetical protein|nr:hypothetical protein [Oscillospiraceae bacterium]
MKKLIILLTTVCAFLVFGGAMTAFAVDDDTPPNNVTITVVLPDAETAEPASATTPAPAVSAATTLYPVDMTENFGGGRRQIVKTYELSPLDNPADIPRADFERSGWTYSVTDILKRETANAETRDHKESVTLSTDTKELEKILTLLAPTLEYKTDDEFVGILSLDVASIKVETAGTRTTSYEMKVTREYPRLSAADTSLVPKTVTDNGKTYNLAGVDWKAGNYVTIDYEQVPEYYTAIATYTATGSSTKVTGYVTTAEYIGTLAKLSQGKTVYTAYFEGTEIRTPIEFAEMPETAAAPSESDVTAATPSETAEPEPTIEPTTEPTDEPADALETSERGSNPNTALYVIIALLALMLGGAIYFIRKGQIHNEKIHNTTPVARDDSDDDDSRSGE